MGTYYSASEAMMLPTPPVPVPLAIATGPRGIGLMARYAYWWITFGDTLRAGGLSDDECLATVAAQAPEDSFLSLAHRYAAIGIIDIVIHGPPTEPPPVADPLVFDHIIGLLP